MARARKSVVTVNGGKDTEVFAANTGLNASLIGPDDHRWHPVRLGEHGHQ